MASDLATMLLQGNAAGVAMDPAMAQIAPDIQLAQAMSQQGMSTAPAYPMQALGRLAQTLAGVKMMHDATGQLSGIYGNAADSASRALPDDHPLQKALKSSDPYARMVALQQFPKALLLASEAKNLKPGDTLSYPVPGVAPAATNTGPVSESGKVTRDVAINPAVARVAPALAGATAGATAAAQNPALIARAGAVKAAEAPYEAGGDVVVQGPNGPVKIPATAATRAAIQPSVPQGPRMPPDEVATGPGPAAGLHLPARPTAAAPAAMPGVTGEPVKTPEFQGAVKGEEERTGAAEKAMGGIVAEAIEGGGRATRDKINALDTMESALRQGGNNVVTGPLAEHALKAKQLMDSLGLDSSGLTKGMPESEIISKMNAQLSAASAKAMTGRPTQAEFQIWMRNNPGLMTSKQGTLALINVLRQQAQQDVDLSKLAQDRGNWKNWPSVADGYFQEHGLTNPITNRPMREEIAAAHGAPGGGGTAVAPNPNATPAKAVPETGQVVNGHKFLGGDPRDRNAWQLLKGDRLTAQ